LELEGVSWKGEGGSWKLEAGRGKGEVGSCFNRQLIGSGYGNYDFGGLWLGGVGCA